MKTQICITVDVEFSISGAFADPTGRQPTGPVSATCPVVGSSGGLDFILDTLERHGLRGVFFVEVLNTCYFGDAPMGTIARYIRDRGHDVQMHLHPCWAIFSQPDWRTLVKSGAPTDSLAGMDEKRLEELLTAGLAVFSRWQLPKPCAFRAGNLQVAATIYPILKRLGIPLSSNIGLGAYRPEDQGLRLAGGRHWIDGVLELPVASHRYFHFGPYERWKTFTVIGTGVDEAAELLRAATKSNASPVVVLTHPSEFVTKTSDDYHSLRVNALSRNRLQKLCAFLTNHADEFEVTTFSKSLPAWTTGEGTINPSWRITPLAIAKRLIENRLAAS
jgi:hypothetical protein